MNNDPIRILQIVSSLNVGSGVLAVVLNWHRHIDTSKVQFDYLYTGDTPVQSKEEIEHLGGRYYKTPNPFLQPLKFIRWSYQFFKEHHYTTVHSHIPNLNFIFYPLAKWFGTKNIIQHAHGTRWSDKRINGIRNYLTFHTACPLITHRVGCSHSAGEVYFKKDFIVVNNGIDVEKFAYNPDVRTAKRKDLGLESSFIIGNIGRFNLQKNHSFLIDIFKEITLFDVSARLVLVSGGPLEETIRQKVISLDLQDKVLFLGIRKDVPDLLQAFDVLCMPSLYEGLPVVGVEAQATGLPCVFADTITSEVLLLPSSCMLSLKDSPVKWAKQILTLKGQPRISGEEILQDKGFDIRQTTQQIQTFYEELEK